MKAEQKLAGFLFAFYKQEKAFLKTSVYQIPVSSTVFRERVGGGWRERGWRGIPHMTSSGTSILNMCVRKLHQLSVSLSVFE